MLIGVTDDGKVYGIPCNRKQEDLLRRQIDCVIGRFHPPVFPDMYSVNFIPVIINEQQDITKEAEFKVIEIKIESTVGLGCRLFETDKGEVYVRRDGSVQGPLKASQIIDWCSYHRTRMEATMHMNERPDAKTVEAKIADAEGQNDFVLIRDASLGRLAVNSGTASDSRYSSGIRPCIDKQAETYALSRLNEVETNIREHQRWIEREVLLMRGYYETREKALQIELENSKYELNKIRRKRKPLSATCIIL